MKISQHRKIRIKEGEYQFKATEDIFNKIVVENFPNLKKDLLVKIEVYRTPNILDRKKTVPYLHNNQNKNHTE